MNRENLLMVADSERDANMLYAVRMFVPDPFIFLRLRGKPHVVLGDLEIDRARQQARHCRAHSLSHIQKQARNLGIAKPSLAQVIRLVLRAEGLKKVLVPYNFPIGLGRELRQLKIKVKVKNQA